MNENYIDRRHQQLLFLMWILSVCQALRSIYTAFLRDEQNISTYLSESLKKRTSECRKKLPKYYVNFGIKIFSEYVDGFDQNSSTILVQIRRFTSHLPCFLYFLQPCFSRHILGREITVSYLNKHLQNFLIFFPSVDRGVFSTWLPNLPPLCSCKRVNSKVFTKKNRIYLLQINEKKFHLPKHTKYSKEGISCLLYVNNIKL